MIDTFYTLKDVSSILKVKEITIKRWIKNGSLGAIRINSRGDYRISKQQLNTYLNDKQV